MGIVTTVFFISSAVSIILLSVMLNNITKPLPVPVFEEQYWGPGNPPKTLPTDIKPFKIVFPEKVVVDLKQRLANTKLQPPLEGIAHEYGMNTDFLKEILTFWQTKYPFKERENYLNKYPHFITKIQGLDIHFMHIKPKDVKDVEVLPLLILHGWPGSIREFYELIPLLTQKQPNRKFVFELIVPSLPGFGFSQPAAKPGLGAVQIAGVLKNLMVRLGHEKYYVQGGDWGSIIAADMAALYKQHVLGLHCNMCLVSTPQSWLKRIIGALYPPMIVDSKYENRYYPLGQKIKNLILESGYYHIQATKPDSLGVGLNDSPAGLAAYILEKFTTATDISWQKRKDGGLKDAFKYEHLIDNLMIYWVSNTATSAMRIYAESTTNLQRVPIEVPSACANFRHELFYTPEGVLKDRYVNLVQNTHYDVGGHFIALQLPEKLAEDIFSGVEKMRAFVLKNNKK